MARRPISRLLELAVRKIFEHNSLRQVAAGAFGAWPQIGVRENGSAEVPLKEGVRLDGSGCISKISDNGIPEEVHQAADQ